MTKARIAAVERQVAARTSRRGSRNRRRASGARRAAPWRRDRSAACCGLKRWPCGRVVGAVHPVAVELAGPDVGQIAVPDLVGVFGQRRSASVSRRPWASNRHSSTLVALAENSAKLTPAPSQVAPSGCGDPGSTRSFVMGLRRAPTRHARRRRGERRQGQRQRGRPAVPGRRLGVDAAAIADVGAAIGVPRRC